MKIRMKNSVEELIPYYVNNTVSSIIYNKPYNIKLDANEGTNYLIDDFSDLNLYPDSDAVLLRKEMAKYYNCKSNNIIAGNGSSEVINVIINAYCDKGDKVLTFSPAFSMYETYCKLCSADLIYVPTDENFIQNVDELIKKAKELMPRIIILCNPNNPTGYANKIDDIEKLLTEITDSIVIVDEAYGDFMNYSSVELINRFDNLIVTRTVSKAFGLAGLRVGCGIANENLIKMLWRVKAPYNLNALSQQVAINAFKNIDRVKDYINSIKDIRDKFIRELEKLNFTVYNSSTNFIFINSTINNLDKKLEDRGIFIRAFGGQLSNYYRITVVGDEQCEILLKELKEILKVV